LPDNGLEARTNTTAKGGMLGGQERGQGMEGKGGVEKRGKKRMAKRNLNEGHGLPGEKKKKKQI